MDEINDPPFVRAPLDALNSDKAWNENFRRLFDATRTLANQVEADGSAVVNNIFLGYIGDPPSGKSEYADARYYIHVAVPQFTADATDQLSVQDDPLSMGNISYRRSIITATNRAELPHQADNKTTTPSGTHLLQKYQPVLVFAIAEQDNPGKVFFTFSQNPIRPCLVRVTSTAGGGGKYFGRILQAPAADVSYSSDLSADDVGANGGPNDVLILNTREVGKTTHDIDISGTFLPTVFVGFRSGTNSDGTLIVVIDGWQTEDCT